MNMGFYPSDVDHIGTTIIWRVFSGFAGNMI
jgi:hypothetical protein